jgi:hypothetical protein
MSYIFLIKELYSLFLTRKSIKNENNNNIDRLKTTFYTIAKLRAQWSQLHWLKILMRLIRQGVLLVSSLPLLSVFVDARRFMDGSTECCLVIHNQAGETIFSACKREFISVEPIVAEALGIRWALEIAIAQGQSSFSIMH